MTAHLDDEALERLACGELSDDDRAEALAHVAACATCSRIFIGLRALAVKASALEPAAVPALSIGTEEEAAPRDELAARRALGRRVMIAGGLALAVAAALLLWLRPGRDRAHLDDDPTTLRGDGATEIAVTTPRGVGPRPARFAWTAVPAATRYTVAVFDLEGRRVWGPSDTTEPALAFPASLAAGRYRWRVEASRDGTVIARSALVAFAVER